MKSSKSLIFDSKYMIQIPNLQTPIHIFSTREVLKNKQKKNKENSVARFFFYKNQYFSAQPQTDSYFITISAS